MFKLHADRAAPTYTFYESIVRCTGHASAQGVFDRSVAVRDNH